MQKWPSRTLPKVLACSQQAMTKGPWDPGHTGGDPNGQQRPQRSGLGAFVCPGLLLVKATEEDSSKYEVLGSSLLTWSYLVTENDYGLA